MLEWLLQYWLDVALKVQTSQNLFYFNGLATVYFIQGLHFADCTLSLACSQMIVKNEY